MLGSLNDLWCLDPSSDTWTKLEEDDDRVGPAHNDVRPCGRLLPAWISVGDSLLLFGGISVLGLGWRPYILNDLWSYSPAAGEWMLLEPHDGRTLATHTAVDGTRPTAVAAMGAAAIGSRLYLMGGWASRSPRFDSATETWNFFLMSPQLWCYDADSHQWEHLGPAGDPSAGWPPKRYCPVMASWRNRLYLWGGRDTDDRDCRFYNDLWEYGPDAGEWRCLQGHDPEDTSRPSPRYGLGHARVDDCWYLFGGFGSTQGNGPQLNDLWCLDLCSGTWACVFPHNGAKDYSSAAERPGVRRVPGMAALGESIYLFDGLDLATGPDDDGPLTGFNDFWRAACVQ